MRLLKTFFCLLGAAFLWTGCGTAGKPETARYENPVLAENCPDPTVLDNRARDGWFYAYSTQGKNGVLPVYRSRDMVHWEFVADGFRGVKPDWEKNSRLWAPDINFVDGRYVLYYALGVWGDHIRSASGVAVADSPSGPFQDQGMIASFANTGVLNAIDPNFFQDGDKKYLLWGSLRRNSIEGIVHPDGLSVKEGIWIIELTADGLSVKPGAEPVKVAGDNQEGVYLHKRGGWYYLFTSEGSCCEQEKSTYHVMVGRARSPLGPFVSRTGVSMIAREGTYDQVILVKNGDFRFVGPGHNSQILTDDAGNDWMYYHAFSKANGYNGRFLLMDRILWDKEGWPYFAEGAPSASSAAPYVKNK